MDSIAIAVFIAAAAQQIIEAVIRPLKLKYPNLDLWWLIYVTWCLGGALSWLAALNLFGAMFPPDAGRVLTAIVVGGGAQLVSEVFKGAAAWRDSLIR